MKKLTPFDYQKIILRKGPKPENLEGYSQWMINKIFSCDRQLVFFVQMLNMLTITDKEHFDFLYHAIPQTGKWIPYLAKKEKVKEIEETIAKHFNVSLKDASIYLDIIAKEELKWIKGLYKLRNIRRTKR